MHGSSRLALIGVVAPVLLTVLAPLAWNDTCRAADPPTPSATGPLRVHPDNPRYFTDETGRAVYLTGAHTWNNLQNNAVYPPVDYAACQKQPIILVAYRHLG